MLFFLFSHFSLLPWFVFLPSSAMLLRNLSFSCADRQVPLLFENMLLQFLQIAEENYIILKAVAQVPALNIHLLPFYSIPSCKELSPGWRTCFRGGRESYPCSQQSSVHRAFLPAPRAVCPSYALKLWQSEAVTWDGRISSLIVFT